MNSGDCPYEECKGFMGMFEVPDKTPVYFETECPECRRPVWYRLSHVEPVAWTKEDFEREFEVNKQTKVVTRKDP